MRECQPGVEDGVAADHSEPVPVESGRGARDGRLPFEANRPAGGGFDSHRDLEREARGPDRQVTRDHHTAIPSADGGCGEDDARVSLDVEEVTRAQMPVAPLVPGIEARGLDRELAGGAVSANLQAAGVLAKEAANGYQSHRLHGEPDLAPLRVDFPGALGERRSLASHIGCI